MSSDTVLVSSDHAGFEMKKIVLNYLDKKGIAYEDLGALEYDATDDYPVFAAQLAKKISAGENKRGITMCGSGIGASITANRFKGVRASLVYEPRLAEMTRRHNNSNVLVLGGEYTTAETAEKILDAWFATEFEGGRHKRRVDLIDPTAK